ncbi:FtsX-like permease family protein [Curtobacterium sp. MCBD17_028]|uniref:FtsX-like permease family protein n=1 Tax=Curtobacterium sp. MCBD17_028 TaxID=2175670 RepID=UPI000DA8FA55|nr:FtsX-like permease family protein [Curtobacterium sp. MCBD17_028]PZE24189.1 hypothetical protein DEI86_13065 [Curtobacterium sp. MCBD17_028]
MSGPRAIGRPHGQLAQPSRRHLVLRGLIGQWAALVAVAVLVAVVTAAGAAAPRLTTALLDADLVHTVDSASPAYRDLSGAVQPDPLSALAQLDAQTASFAQTWTSVPSLLQRVRTDAPRAVRRVLDRGHVAASAAGVAPPGRPTPDGFAATGPRGGVHEQTAYRIQTSPELRAAGRLVAGHWPHVQTGIGDGTVLQVVASRATVRAMHWRVGRRQDLVDVGGDRYPVRLVGVFVPRHPGSGLWSQDPNRRTPSTMFLPDGTPVLHGSVFVDAATWPAIAPAIGGTTVQVWFGLHVDRLDEASVPAVRQALTRMLADPTPVDATSGDQRSLLLGTFLPQLLALHEERAAASAAVLALSATGPLGVAGVTLLLAVSGLLARRRAVRALLRDRGAGAGALAGGAARDLAVASVPGAALGALAAVLTIPVGGWDWTPAALAAAAAPPALAAVVALAEVLGQRRRRPLLPRFRWVAEALVVAMAVGATAVVAQRAAAPTGGARPVDAFVTVTPLLLAAALVVLLLRVRPRLARLVVGLVRRRGAAAFVGTAEDVRSGPTAGWVLATIVGATSIAVTAGVVVTSAAAVDLPVDGRTRGVDTHPLVGGLVVVVVAGLVLSAAMTAAAIALTVVSAAPVRQRRGAMLRTLGLTGRQRTAVTLWELGPRVLLGLVAGVVLGLAAVVAVVPAIVPRTADHAVAVLTVDPLATTATVGLLALAAVLATLAAVVVDRRRSGVTDGRDDT